jgi:hypothetical protein
MSAWGGPKRRVYGVLFGWFIASLLGDVLFGLGRVTQVWMVAAFFGMFFIPIINGSNQAIWQAKVPPDLQGKVFSIRRLIAWFVSPLAMLIAGPLSDKILEPAMQDPQSALASATGWFMGIGPAAGLLFVIGDVGSFGWPGWLYVSDLTRLIFDARFELFAVLSPTSALPVQELLKTESWAAQPDTPSVKGPAISNSLRARPGHRNHQRLFGYPTKPVLI